MQVSSFKKLDQLSALHPVLMNLLETASALSASITAVHLSRFQQYQRVTDTSVHVLPMTVVDQMWCLCPILYLLQWFEIREDHD